MKGSDSIFEENEAVVRQIRVGTGSNPFWSIDFQGPCRALYPVDVFN